MYSNITILGEGFPFNDGTLDTSCKPLTWTHKHWGKTRTNVWRELSADQEILGERRLVTPSSIEISLWREKDKGPVTYFGLTKLTHKKETLVILHLSLESNDRCNYDLWCSYVTHIRKRWTNKLNCNTRTLSGYKKHLLTLHKKKVKIYKV